MTITKVNKTPEVRTGAVASGSLSANAVKTIDVTFSSPFPSGTTPRIALTPSTGVTDFLRYTSFGVSNVSVSGFTMNIYSSAAVSTGRYVNYIAIV